MKFTIPQVRVLSMLVEEGDSFFMVSEQEEVVSVEAWSTDSDGDVCLMKTDIFPDGTLSSERK
jgi:hypothetical protein